MKYSGTKKILALALVLVMGLSMLSVGAMASEEMPAVGLMDEIIPLPEEILPEEDPVTDAAPAEETEVLPEEETPVEEPPVRENPVRENWINPLYADRITPEDLPTGDGVSLDGGVIPYFTSAKDVAAYIRDMMAARAEEIPFEYYGDFDEVMSLIFAHTGDPKEGDSLLFQIGGWDWNDPYYDTMLPLYYTDAAQEAATDTAVEALMEELELPRASDYETVRAVHAYLRDEVTYDYDYKEASAAGDDTPWSTYGALVKGTCVCQGYSLAMYRLLLECGIDCRIIAGVVNAGGHAWNIVELDGLYYNVDATWDSCGWGEYYFLRGKTQFYKDHTPGESLIVDYSWSSSFWDDYPMSLTDYDSQNSGGGSGGNEEEEPGGIPINAANFPDDKFRAYVANNLDRDLDSWLSAAEIEKVTEINVSGRGIWDMTGVGFFTELRVLDCYDNNIENLDVSGFLGLEYLDVGENILESLTLGQQDYLYALYCDNNSLTKLDVTGCPGLWFMWCHNNALEKLDLTGCPQLVELSCYDNYIEDLDVSPCPVLGALVETIPPEYYYDYGIVDYYYQASEDLYYELLTDIGVMIYTRELLGDVNADGYINAADAMLVLMHAVGTGTLTGEAAYQADVNGDEVIDARDAAQILRYGNGLSSVIGRTAPG